jgi:beta-glucosidase
MFKRYSIAAAALALASCTGPSLAQQGVARPEIWPAYEYPVPQLSADEARIADLLRRMTIEEKVGQLVQADLCCVTPEDVRRYNLGSVLNGGNSGPYGNDLAPASDWLKLADEFYAASTDTSDGGVGIPLVWGTDAVHGHSNIIGATLFPHNIGLGAMRDPAVIERIGAATAAEIRVTGQEWTFAPTVAVPQDFRWGRAYEGYSSDPALVASYVGAMVRGLQGPPDAGRILQRGKVIASTKHFLADGGTDKGVDQGDATISEEALRDIHGAPYGPAIQEGVGTVMASFSSWQGVKMTGNKSLLTGVLKDRMDFGGFVVSDWNAHGQVEGCSNASCPQALLAGIDMYMAPDTWKPVYESLLAQAKSGEIPMSRVDDAVARILRVKLRLGLFEAGTPSARALSGQWNLLGAPDHRALAREAVRKSLVLLRNDGVLPLKPGGRLLVAGDGADDIARQSGGWTLTWQGTGLENSQFPGATSLWQGLREAVTSAGGSAELSADGSFTNKPDAAVVIFGEKPYAEFQGDRASLQLDPALAAPFETMRKLKAQGIPVVAVMITGRPLYVNPALNAADAFVVTWLPGSEGAGLADVLVGDRTGKPRFDFTGTLPAAWPRTASMEDGALYPFGYGLTYASPRTAWSPLAEDAGAGAAGDGRTFLTAGVPASSWSFYIEDPTQPASQIRLTAFPADALDGRARATVEEGAVQEGARRFRIAGGQSAVSLGTFDPIDVSRETNGDVLLLFTLRMFDAPDRAGIAMRDAAGALQVATVQIPQGTEFVRYGLSLKCLRDKGIDMTKVAVPFILATEGATDFAISDVRLGTDAQVTLPCT